MSVFIFHCYHIHFCFSKIYSKKILLGKNLAVKLLVVYKCILLLTTNSETYVRPQKFPTLFQTYPLLGVSNRSSKQNEARCWLCGSNWVFQVLPFWRVQQPWRAESQGFLLQWMFRPQWHTSEKCQSYIHIRNFSLIHVSNMQLGYALGHIPIDHIQNNTMLHMCLPHCLLVTLYKMWYSHPVLHVLDIMVVALSALVNKNVIGLTRVF